MTGKWFIARPAGDRASNESLAPPGYNASVKAVRSCRLPVWRGTRALLLTFGRGGACRAEKGPEHRRAADAEEQVHLKHKVRGDGGGRL